MADDATVEDIERVLALAEKMIILQAETMKTELARIRDRLNWSNILLAAIAVQVGIQLAGLS